MHLFIDICLFKDSVTVAGEKKPIYRSVETVLNLFFIDRGAL